ncbi:ribosomal RNA small subunit methyltransferase A [Candidatus Uhrbacteria bacterium]|nr:ribosomal RNA small subunit methyltransferase A [Candidatus Uhrbacteria bacterium]
MHLKPTEIRELLGTLGKKPNKSLGQHFLIDPSVIHAMIRRADLLPKDVVLEVGPGLGVLTNALLDTGANVIAIEQDRSFALMLGSTLHDRKVSIIHGNAVEVDWVTTVGNGRWKFIANLPYAVTSLMLRKALYHPNPPTQMLVLIQKEVGERIQGAGRKVRGVKPSLLSLMVALASSSSRIIRKVPPRCFYPSPRVDSVVFEIIPLSQQERIERWGIDPEEVMKVAKQGFAHPRKLLISNLSVGASHAMLSKQEIENILVDIGANPKSRPEDLSLDQWVELAKRLV